jgi:hypothetical protein
MRILYNVTKDKFFAGLSPSGRPKWQDPNETGEVVLFCTDEEIEEVIAYLKIEDDLYSRSVTISRVIPQ